MRCLLYPPVVIELHSGDTLLDDSQSCHLSGRTCGPLSPELLDGCLPLSGLMLAATNSPGLVSKDTSGDSCSPGKWVSLDGS